MKHQSYEAGRVGGSDNIVQFGACTKHVWLTLKEHIF